MGAIFICQPDLLGQNGLCREGIINVIANDFKEIVLWGRSPMSFNFGMVFKKINYMLFRFQGRYKTSFRFSLRNTQILTIH